MQNFLPAILLPAVLLVAGGLSCQAQTPAQPAAGPPAGANWSHVQSLPAGTDAHINTAHHHHMLCNVTTVTDDSITCTRNRGLGKKEFTFQRSAITSIKLPRRTASGFAGAAIGAAGGAAVGLGIDVATGNTNSGKWFPYIATEIFTVVGIIPGAILGYGTDFAAGPTIYRAQ